jgi:hypothetical protein
LSTTFVNFREAALTPRTEPENAKATTDVPHHLHFIILFYF